MRVLAYYGTNDIRDEEWPKPKKLQSGEARVEVRAVTLGENDRRDYLSGAWKAPSVIGRAGAGLVTEAGESGLSVGQPVVVWLPQDAPQGLAAESVQVPLENILPIEKALSYAEMSFLPHLAELLAVLPKAEGTSCRILGGAALKDLLNALLPLRGYVPAKEDEEASYTVCLRADKDVLTEAIHRTKRGGKVQIISMEQDSQWDNLPLALRKGLCFNLGAVFGRELVAEAFALFLEHGLSAAAKRLAVTWDDVEKAFPALEKESFVTLTQESFPEPYFP